jgi:AraC-like DNA-binding protein
MKHREYNVKHMTTLAAYREDLLTIEKSSTTEAVWMFRATTHGSSIVLPDGRSDLILKFNDKCINTVETILTAAADQPYQVPHRPSDTWIGTRLRPGIGQLLTSGKVKLNTNEVLAGEDVTRLFPKLQLALMEQTSTAKLALILSDCASSIDAKPLSQLFSAAAKLAHITGGRIKASALSKLLNCSTRHLARLFKTWVGFTLKTYLQIVQFHRCLRLIAKENLKPIEAAYEAGYSDQSHMTRAFRRFGGFSPRAIPKDLVLIGFPNV